MKNLGTILPSAASLASTDKWAREIALRQDAFASKHPILLKCERNTEGGETRFYLTQSCYAVISRSIAIRWFERRADGHDYAITQPISSRQ